MLEVPSHLTLVTKRVLCHVLLLAILLLATGSSSDQFRFTRSLKNGFDAAQNVVKDTVSGVYAASKEAYDNIASPLGPEPDQDESCPREGCEAAASQEEPDSVSEDNEHGLTVLEEEQGVLGQLYDLTSGGLATVYKTAKENIYDNGARMVSDFADKVREIVHEELYTFLASVTSSLADALLTPGATLYYLGQTAMSVTLLLICLFLTYLFVFTYPLFMLAMNASVLLLHQFLGPMWIFDKLIWICGYCSSVLWWMVKHYYVSSVLIVLVFVYSILIPLVRWWTQKTPRQMIQELEISILDISRRLGQVEDRQREMLDILRRLDTRQERN